MKVKVDFDLCESNALCEDFLVVKKEEIGAAEEAAVRRAVAACPRSAISLLDS